LTSIDDVIRLLEAARDSGSLSSSTSSKKEAPAKKAKRKPSAYSQAYGKAFKRLAPKYKKKDGGWKKGGFKACQKAAHAAARGKRK